MKIGIGVTTYNRPEHLKLWWAQIGKFITKDCIVYVAKDSDDDRQGIAFRKNECLINLQDCDYVFLFDDDCFPIKADWASFFISEFTRTRQHHFLYLKETSTLKKIDTRAGIDIYNNCGGCFIFITNEVMKRVGGYCKDYGIYGYEHAGYSSRIFSAGLNTYGAYLCPQQAQEYIYSLDYDFHQSFKIKHTSSFSKDEMRKIKGYIQKNAKIYQKDIQTIYQPL